MAVSAKNLRIVADENIPFVKEAFASFGEVRCMPGRAIGPEDLREADVLLVRSITQVNSALLDGSPVRYVATATIGEDHIDKTLLAERGIGFTSAPGCNANSVAEYIVAALLHLARQHSLDLSALSIGIVGFGNVGTKVSAKARALGMRVVVNDAPLAGATCEAFYRPMGEIFACDIVTLHVPLEKDGPYPTRHLASMPFFESMKPGSIFVNTSRGAVADNKALLQVLTQGHLRATVLDVFENEPVPDPELVQACAIATPHIAGYSFDGKVNGTCQIREGARRFFEHETPWDPAPLLPQAECPERHLHSTGMEAVREAVEAVYGIMKDDAGLRAAITGSEAERGAAFDTLRKTYGRRREFRHTTVTLASPCPETLRMLRELGFRVAPSESECP